MNNIIFKILTAVFLLTLASKVKAEYILPYPSYMPGNKLYKVSQMIDNLERLWHMGTLASIKYHMKQSDKKLIEAKTLFEYSQYLLAVQALEMADIEFKQIQPLLIKTYKEDKGAHYWDTIFAEQKKKHIEILEKLINELPEEFAWRPEKQEEIKLNIHESLTNSQNIRK